MHVALSPSRQALFRNKHVECNGSHLDFLPVAFKYALIGQQIGDDSGIIHCYEMKRGEAQSVFSSRIAGGDDNSGGGGSGSMITAVAMGGNSSGLGGGDRVFATQVYRFT